MKSLIIETSSEKACLILAQGSKPIAARVLPGGAELSKKLPMEVKRLLDCHSFKPDFIAAGTGPGSYTGVRVGAALAKSLALGWQIPLLGFCSLKGFVPPIEGSFVILVDARMGGFYALFGTKENDRLSFETPLLISPADARLQRISHFASPHPELILKRAPIAAFSFETA
ncbi:MAG TPA: tRNA (adenosine(37)-N6)-threonylcarbamoyltransferase complex dimerization subunit type 1 TsaB, partial [Chlamydiales bacterium]|nr:tRNA (adenosine(37)-N6)-threonylcarbamoyltransferase complex dimerization subunit type 1 TsaB [Chlamydiales bacterium]